MKIKWFFICFGCGLFIASLFYFGTAFTIWELNPANWTAHNRSFISVFGGLFLLIGAVSGVLLSVDPPKEQL